MDEFATPQEAFWAGEFGAGYIDRNHGDAWVKSNEALFARILASTTQVESIVELGCNIGLNLIALRNPRPHVALRGYEINHETAAAARLHGGFDVVEQTVVEPIDVDRTFDLAFTKGVLIHINPEFLSGVYENLARLSTRYILVCEYYNPSPVAIPYRGHDDRLFKRDFAGEIMDHHDLSLVDYGFVYHRDAEAPQDDITWFLLEKSGTAI
jgi:pseudaminic acid biosynthesis-associated methylase